MSGAEEGGPVETRFGTVAMIGPSNVGKSTLVNHLVGTKVAIVTPKVQTTRGRVLGLMTRGGSQVALIDTPGIFVPRLRIERAMVASAWQGADEADHVVLMVDAASGGGKGKALQIARQLVDRDRTATLVLNKIDLVKKTKLLDLATAMTAAGRFDAVFMVSALTGDGVDDLADMLAAAVPPGPWHYPEDQLSDMPMRLLAAEITREKAFLALEQELPYGLAVETETWREHKDGLVEIGQVIHVARPSHKAIVLGARGSMIKGIGTAARLELQEILETRVRLDLFVRVSEKWMEDPERLRDLGIEPGAS